MSHIKEMQNGFITRVHLLHTVALMDPQSLRVAKVFPLECNSNVDLDFHSNGELCIVSQPNPTATLTLYDCLEGTTRKTILSKKYGVGKAVRFTHHPNAIIYSSSDDGTIRYLSLHDNAYLRYFRGHVSPVTSLEMSPSSADIFLSGAAPNDSVRLWDLRTGNCEGQLSLNSSDVPLIAWDPQGMVVAIALESRYLRLYDVGGLEKGPFAAFEIEDPSRPTKRTKEYSWSSIAFCPDGKEILIGTVGGRVSYVINSFTGHVNQVLLSPNTAGMESLESMKGCWSMDSKFVFGGNINGLINVWDCKSVGVQPVHQLEGHSSTPYLIKCNPKYSMMASVSSHTLSFWLPK